MQAINSTQVEIPEANLLIFAMFFYVFVVTLVVVHFTYSHGLTPSTVVQLSITSNVEYIGYNHLNIDGNGAVYISGYVSGDLPGFVR